MQEQCSEFLVTCIKTYKTVKPLYYKDNLDNLLKIKIIFMFASQFTLPKVNVIFQDTFQIML